MRSDFWNIDSREEFEQQALELFKFQAQRCEPFGRYLSLIGCDPTMVESLEEIRYLPIEIFKSSDVYCGENPPAKIFTSSSTTGSVPSRHIMADLALYEAAFVEGFNHFYGDIHIWSLYGLLPSYLEREGSSLIYMVDKLIAMAAGGGFYLHNHKQLLADMDADPNPKILLGVSYALWDLAENNPTKLNNTIVMETGGMKGQREEIHKEQLHKILCNAFGVEQIHSEYGMAELTSQAYSKGMNRFSCPPWMKVVAREVNDPFNFLQPNHRGALNIIDLASRYSCAFIETQDMGVILDDDSFILDGRVQNSEIRGCNLLVQ
ncbi:MAG: acyltransferase [Rikenellaceae bacterium]